MQDIIAAICEAAGYQYRQHRPAYGGDINSCFTVFTNEGELFLKLNDASQFPQMFEREAEGLGALSGISQLTIPEIKAVGQSGGYQYLLLNNLEKGIPRKDFWQQFATGLADIHKTSDLVFGWQNDNYIGSLVQPNQQQADWSSFYAYERILPLIKMLFDNGAFDENIVFASENLSKKIRDNFPPEPPALLHGDLWSGNFMVGSNGYAAIYDPAVYYGHREMDIGMTKLFGGFTDEFYRAYNEIFPLEKNWMQRVPLTQLYPLLVHAVLFGCGYISTCTQIIKTRG
jgi:fructosamine-3-kinase